MNMKDFERELGLQIPAQALGEAVVQATEAGYRAYVASLPIATGLLQFKAEIAPNMVGISGHTSVSSKGKSAPIFGGHARVGKYSRAFWSVRRFSYNIEANPLATQVVLKNADIPKVVDAIKRKKLNSVTMTFGVPPRLSTEEPSWNDGKTYDVTQYQMHHIHARVSERFVNFFKQFISQG